MPVPDQQVAAKLRDALDAAEIAPELWIDHGAQLHRRAASLRARRLLALTSAAAVVIAAVMGGIALTGGRSHHRDQTVHLAPRPVTNYVVTARTQLAQQGGSPQFVTGHGSAFLVDWTHGRILRLDVATLKVTGQLSIGGPQDSVLSVAYGHGALWALDFSSSSLLRIDPDTMQVTHTTPVSGQPSDVEYGHGQVWLTAVGRTTNPRTRQLLERINPVTGAVTGQVVIAGNGQSEQLAIGDMIAVSGETGPIMIIDPATMKIVQTMPVPGQHPASMTSLYGQIYAITTDRIVRLSTSDGAEPVIFRQAQASFGSLNRAPTISAAAGLLWASENSQILGIEPGRGEITSTGQVADASQVEPTSGAGAGVGALLAAVSNGIVRLQHRPSDSRWP